MVGSEPTDGDDATEEFETETDWVGRALADLDGSQRLPGACRGSGPPPVYAWIADRLDVGSGDPFLDLGGGLGGPAAWLRDRTGARPVLVDAHPGGLRWAKRLFALETLIADGPLPFPPGSHAGGWALATLSTVADRGVLLAEARRVLRPGAVFAVQEHLRLVDEIVDPPPGNDFLVARDLTGLLADHGFQEEDRAWADELGRADDEWETLVRRATQLVRDRHAGAEELQVADRTGARFAELTRAGQLRSLVAVFRRR